MARILRGLLAIAGVVVVLWLVRDRFVTIGLPKNVEPVSFRVAPHDPTATPPPTELTDITGIGPVYAERLSDAGIDSAHDLAAATPATVADAAGVSEERAAGWIDAARR